MLDIVKAAGALQPTHSPTSLPSHDTDNAAVATEVGPPADPHPNIAATDRASTTAAITVPTDPPEKTTSGVPALAEAPQYKEDAPSVPAEVTEKTPLAISAGKGAESMSDAPVPEAQLSDADRALFTQRGSELLAAGDIASARLFFERAANAGDVRSALGMAMTFDPVELARAGVRGLTSDQAKADYWYQRARSLAGDRNFDTPVKENRRD